MGTQKLEKVPMETRVPKWGPMWKQHFHFKIKFEYIVLIFCSNMEGATFYKLVISYYLQSPPVYDMDYQTVVYDHRSRENNIIVDSSWL